MSNRQRVKNQKDFFSQQINVFLKNIDRKT